MKKLAIPVLGLVVVVVMMTMAAGCGDDSTGDCLPNDHTQCSTGITYWMDSCGTQGTVAEVCDCGCNVDFTGCDQACSCVPDCTDKVCGDDGCDGSCGDCGTGESCTTAGQCIVCTPDCTGLECGDDGCGGSCGTCTGAEICDTTGQCIACTPDCTGLECGDDGCGGSCGTCTGTDTCDGAGQCVACTPSCVGLDCGDDGCGGSCGTCQPNETCNSAQLCEAAVTDILVFNNCAVPYVLDAAQVTDQTYMLGHFADLVQQYCITGGYAGNDISAYPEKMYYGQHDSGSMLSLVQISMSAALSPEWTVKVDFSPDTDFTTSSIWNASVGGINPPEATVGLIRHLGTQNMCIKAIGTTGTITVASAVSCTQQEGGNFTLSGQVQLTNPWDLSQYCSQTPPNLPCCP